MARSSRLRLVLFDCDGTLVDSQHHILAAMCSAFAACGYPAPRPAAVRQIIGLSLPAAVAVLLPRCQADVHGTVVAHYKAAFAALRMRSDHDEPLFLGARECLDRLTQAGFLLGIATGKSRRGLDGTLRMHGLLERFTTLQTADVAPGKPHPEMVLRALAETGVEPADALVVGDTSFDMLMAKNAGVSAIGVGWGYHAPASLRADGAVEVADHFDQIAPMAERLMGVETCA